MVGLQLLLLLHAVTRGMTAGAYLVAALGNCCSAVSLGVGVASVASIWSCSLSENCRNAELLLLTIVIKNSCDMQRAIVSNQHTLSSQLQDAAQALQLLQTGLVAMASLNWEPAIPADSISLPGLYHLLCTKI